MRRYVLAMQMLRLLSLLAFLLTFSLTYGQSPVPNSRETGKLKVYHSPHHTKATKGRKAKVTHTARYEFYERVEKAAKEKQRIIKRLSKAQFSDPQYFGHKRIPKQRLSFKMRYCNECGIRH